MTVILSMKIDPLATGISRSPAMMEVLDLARRLADVECTVLLSGESGTGKERVARFLHDQSPRANGPFVAINCGAMTESLLESELFGHAKGSFTGAVDHRVGLLEAADGGSLLLDELGEVSLAMQVKLLRALQTREIRRVGENIARPINVRIVAATNRDLAQAVTDGTFRQDLYYRLKVVELRLPPLRARREDVLSLAIQLLNSAAARLRRSVTGFTPAVAERLLRHDWPGNVRELENAMERGVALTRGSQIDVNDLPEELRGRLPLLTLSSVEPTMRTLAQVEREHIFAVLESHAGNQTHAARALQISTATLYRKLKSYGLVAAPGKLTHVSPPERSSRSESTERIDRLDNTTSIRDAWARRSRIAG